MARAQPVEINGHKFERKTDALSFLKSMLYRYRPGDTVSASDGAFLAQALKRHPDAIAKIGAALEALRCG